MFNVEQTEGCEIKAAEERALLRREPIEAAEAILRGMPDAPPIEEFRSGGLPPFYNADHDRIMVPEKAQYERLERWYSSVFHELIHATGHRKRLNRPEMSEYRMERIHTRGKEEMTAGMGQAILAGLAGIGAEQEKRDAAYIAHWRDVIAADKGMVIQAAAKAQKAVDYILGESRQAETDEPRPE